MSKIAEKLIAELVEAALRESGKLAREVHKDTDNLVAVYESYLKERKYRVKVAKKAVRELQSSGDTDTLIIENLRKYGKF